jgi:hypothetical protein
MMRAEWRCDLRSEFSWPNEVVRMSRQSIRISIPVVAALFLLGCDRNAVSTSKVEAPVSVSVPQPAPIVPSRALSPEAYDRSIFVESRIPTNSQRAVSNVNSVSLDLFGNGSDAVMIRAAGMVAGNWTGPALIPIEEGTNDLVSRFRFVATPNELGGSEQQAVYVRLRVDLPRSVKKIEIVAEQNTASVTVVRPETSTDVAAAAPP